MSLVNMMPIAADPETMLTLSADRRMVRLALPPLPIDGMPEPIKVNMDWDAETVEAITDRLLVLRAQMLPARQGH
jgi:hypothetical protein